MGQFRKRYLIIAYVVSLSMVYLFANNSQVSALEKPVEIKTETDIIYSVEKNNKQSLQQVKKAILKNDTKYVLEPKTFKEDLENSEIILDKFDPDTDEVQKISARVIRYITTDGEKVPVDEVSGEALIKFADTTAPVLKLKKKEITIDYDEDIDLEQQVAEVYDNVDGYVPVEIDHDLDTKEAGTYTITYTAQDKAGNKTVETLEVTVKEKPKPKPKPEPKPQAVAATSNQASYAASPANPLGGTMSGDPASLALGLVGANMHCTQLTSTVLQSKIGDYKSLSPAQTMSYTTPVSDMQPGDILYYHDAGAGVPHVAVYIGNGQAVHGGLNGKVSVASAHLGSGVAQIGRP